MTVYPDDQDPSFTVAYTDKSVADGYVRVVLKDATFWVERER